MKLVEDFFNKLLQEIGAKYFPNVKYYRDNKEDADAHYTVELFNNGCLVYSELIRRLAVSCNEKKEEIHRIVSQYVTDFESYEYNPATASDLIDATFVSVWDGSTEVPTACTFNPNTNEVVVTESTDDVEDLDILFEEYVRLPNGETINNFNIDGIEVVNGQRQDEE